MRTKITIHQNDADLQVLLSMLGKKEFCNLMRDACRALVRPEYIGTKVTLEDVRDSLQPPSTYKTVILRFGMEAEKDADIQRILARVPERMIGVFLKTVLRHYLGMKLVLLPFLQNTEEICEADVRIIKITEKGTVHKTTRRKGSIKRGSNDIPVNTISNMTLGGANPQKQEVTPKQKQETSSIPMPNKEPNIIPVPTPVNTDQTGTDSDDFDVLSLLEGLID